MLELLGREATNAGRAERVVMRYFRVRIRVRGDASRSLQERYTLWLYSPCVKSSAKGLAKVSQTFSPPTASATRSGGTLSRTSFAVFLFLLGPGIVFEYGKGVLSGALPLSRGSREVLPNSVPRDLFPR